MTRFLKLAAIAFLIYIIGLTVLLVSIFFLGKKTITSLQSGEFAQAQKTLSLLQARSQVVNTLTFGILSRQYISPAKTTFSLASIMIKFASTLQEYAREVQNPSSQLVQEKYVSMKEAFVDLQSFWNVWQKQRTQSLGLWKLLEKRNVLSMLDETGAFLDFFEKFTPFLGYAQDQEDVRVLVLLQNNMELRATGGFMGSFAELEFKRGAMQNLTVQDIYVPDGQLKGYVEPPAPLKEYLFQTGGWRLRDANWDPNFPDSAKTISWFFNQGGSKQYNVIVAINLHLVQEILEITGPLYLTDYNQEISAQNIYSFAQVQTEKDFFPGATNKADVLGAIARAFQRAIIEKASTAPSDLLKYASQAFEQKDVLVWSEQEALQKLVVANGWDGSIKKVDCEHLNCISHSLYLVENNLSINKTNCCMERKAGYDVWIDKNGNVKTELKLFYRNNNPVTPIPPRYYGGGYRNYLRVYTDLPVVRAVTDQHEVEKSNITTQKHDDLKLLDFGWLVEVPGQETETVDISFQEQKLSFDESAVYELYLQKQPGLLTNEYTIRFHVPEDLMVEEKEIEGELIQEPGFYQTTIQVDKNTKKSFVIQKRK